MGVSGQRLAVAAAFAVGAIVGLIQGSARPMPLSPERVFAAENLTLMVVSTVVAIIAAWLLWDRCRWRFWSRLDRDPACLGVSNHLLAGIVVMEAGWALNRGYWYVYRVLNELGHTAIADHVAYHFGSVSRLSLAMVVAGLVIAMRPVLRAWLGMWWGPITAAALLALWIVGYESPDAWRYMLGCGGGLAWDGAAGKCV